MNDMNKQHGRILGVWKHLDLLNTKPTIKTWFTNISKRVEWVIKLSDPISRGQDGFPHPAAKPISKKLKITGWLLGWFYGLGEELVFSSRTGNGNAEITNDVGGSR